MGFEVVEEAGTLIVIESTTLSMDIFSAIHARGVRPLLLTGRPERIPFLPVEGIYVEKTNTADISLLRRRVLDAAQEENLIGILTPHDSYVGVAAVLAAELALPGPSPTCIAACQDKERQRKVALVNGLPVPWFGGVGNVVELRELSRGLTYPLIIKPTMGTASFGVQLCYNRDQLEKAAKPLFDRKYNARGLAVRARALVEQYIEGEEYSVEIFDGNAVAVTKKELCRLPMFFEIGHEVPANLSADLCEKMMNVAESAVRALGVEWGPSHVELRVKDREVYLMEVNAGRLGGDLIPLLVERALGINLYSATIDRHVGIVPELNVNKRGVSRVHFFRESQKISQAAAARLVENLPLDGVDRVFFSAHSSGGILRPFDADRVGYVVVTGENSTRCSQILGEILERLATIS